MVDISNVVFVEYNINITFTRGYLQNLLHQAGCTPFLAPFRLSELHQSDPLVVERSHGKARFFNRQIIIIPLVLDNFSYLCQINQRMLTNDILIVH